MGFPMVFLWFSYGFPMVFLWFSYGFPMVFPLKPPFSYESPGESLGSEKKATSHPRALAHRASLSLAAANCSPKSADADTVDAADALGLRPIGNSWSNNLTKLGSTQILCIFIYLFIYLFIHYIYIYHIILCYIILYCIISYYIMLYYIYIYISLLLYIYIIISYIYIIYIIYILYIYILYIYNNNNIYTIYIYLWLDEVLDLAGEC